VKNAIGLFTVIALAALPAVADGEGDTDVQEQARVVIQNRKFKLGNELTLGFAALPIDPFHKGLAGTVRYTFHINDFNAWEVAGGTYAFNLDSSLTEQLLKNFGVQRQQLPALLASVESNYVMKPFYGKFALANRNLLYQEVYLVAGATVSYWDDGSIRSGPDIGGGVRFFWTEWLSWRFDIRQAVLFSGIPFVDDKFGIDGSLYLGTALSLNVGG
jgi:outer membrane beta-barrel protein